MTLNPVLSFPICSGYPGLALMGELGSNVSINLGFFWQFSCACLSPSGYLWCQMVLLSLAGACPSCGPVSLCQHSWETNSLLAGPVHRRLQSSPSSQVQTSQQVLFFAVFVQVYYLTKILYNSQMCLTKASEIIENIYPAAGEICE